jgi:hypothetical protein
MSYLIDEVARTLAKPHSRRKVLRVIGGAIAAAFMATVGAKRASAVGGCNSGDTCANGTACCNGSGSGNKGACCNHGQCCCGTAGNGSCTTSVSGSNCLQQNCTLVP